MEKIGYARVSTVDQNPQLQIDALVDAGCTKIYTEKASGAKRDRPELKALLEYVRKDDQVIVWKLDRLARSMKQLIETVEDLEERGIQFTSLTEAIDTSTPSGRLIFTIFGALAEFERNLIRERTMAGLIAARKEGRTGGRPGKLSDKDIKAAKAMIKSGMNVEETAKKLGVGRSTLYNHL